MCVLFGLFRPEPAEGLTTRTEHCRSVYPFNYFFCSPRKRSILKNDYTKQTKTMKNKITKIRHVLIIALAHILISSSIFAQAPQKMSYQAVIRNSNDSLLISTPVGMRISLVQSSPTGTVVFSETQTATTNANGLVSLQIGMGTAVIGTFASIDWAAGPYYVKTETDLSGGTNYTIISSNELLSVPYALFSANGTPGPVGPQGQQGDQGPQGIAGTNGNDGLAGPQGPQGIAGTNGNDGATGPQGIAGTNGSNAYQVAVANGFIGTETQWLESLKGTNGTNGETGATGPAGTFPSGTLPGEMNYWNGTAWVTVAPGSNNQNLTFCFGVPTWGPCPTSIPTVTTTQVWAITQTSASSGGVVTSNGGGALSAWGICWSTSANPTLANSFLQNTVSSGSFSSALSGLTQNTTYYVRAYATNSAGTAYGNEVSFSTSNSNPNNLNVIYITDTVLNDVSYHQTSFLYPTKLVFSNLTTVNGYVYFHQTNNIVEIEFPLLVSTGNSFYVNGNSLLQKITAPNLSSIYNYLYVDGNQNLQILDICNLTDIFCLNSQPYVYTDFSPLCFTPTLHEDSLLTNPITLFSNNTAIASGVYITSCGSGGMRFCWSTNPNPTNNDFTAQGNSSGGTFTANLTGLTPNTTYYVRAYENNIYGNQISFTTQP